MIRNIIFDIGGVLADFEIVRFLSEKGFDGPTIKRIIKASVLSPYWGKFERAEITEEETLKGFVTMDREIEQELYAAFSNIEGMLTIRDYAIPLVKSLKACGLGIYYLSNYSKKAYDECGESLAFMRYMDGGVVSFRVGMTKPDPRVYELFLREYGLDPAECVFVDDTPENVEAAEALGFQGICFTTYDQLIERLNELGGSFMRAARSDEGVRVERALYLLDSGELSVAEISDLCNYGDPSYFGKAFRKRTGLTLSLYQERKAQE